MTRVLSAVAVVFLVAATFVLPEARHQSPGPAPDIDPVGHAVCLVDEGVGRTTEIAAASLDPGTVRMTLFTAGRPAGTMGVDLEPEGSTVIPIVDIAAVGTVGALVEFPSRRGAAGSGIRGAGSLAAEACVSEPAAEVYLTGGRTVSPERFEVHLLNPWASDAVVSLSVTSEIGTESNDRFNSVVIRAMSNVVIDMTQLTPGRERLSVRVESQTGRVTVIGRQTGPEEGAIWNAVVPAADWFIPLIGMSGDVLIGNPYPTEVEYQVDVYGSLGLEPALLSGTVGRGGQVVLDLSVLEDPDVHGVRVIATTPVVAGVRQGANPAWATTAAAVPALEWLVPIATHASPDGAEDEDPAAPESGFLLIFNPGIDHAEISISALGVSGRPSTLVLLAEDAAAVPVSPADGYLVRSDRPVVVFWLGGTEGRGAILVGVAVDDG
jgi:hypothetical protein